MTRIAAMSRSERGAVLVHVAVCLVALTAFSALAVDYGVLWVSRAQAQNAADAGAHAGAIALAFDGFSDRGETGPAQQTARAVAVSNFVWLESPSVTPGTDITFPSGTCKDFVSGDPASYLGQTPCIRVDVHRTTARGNPLPTFFGRLVGVDSQSVRATATAQVVSANVIDCLSPIAIPDRWVERNPSPFITWQSGNPAVRFQRYSAPGVPLAPPDDYVPPSPGSTGTGYRTGDAYGFGYRLTLEEAPPGYEPIGTRQFIAVEVPRTVAATNNLQANVESCNGEPIAIGSTLRPLGSGNLGSIRAGLDSVFDDDPTASWNPGLGRIQNSCASDNPPCRPFSPRLLALPVFDVARYDETRWSGNPELRVVNVLGFFVEEYPGATIVGRFAPYPGQFNQNLSSLLSESAFLRTAMLVR